MNKSIIKKLAAGFGLSLLLIIAVVGYNYFALRKLEILYEEALIHSRNLKLAAAAQQTGTAMHQIIADTVINRDLVKSNRKWVVSKKESLEKVRSVAKVVTTPEEQTNIREAEEAIHDIIRLYEHEMLPLIDAGSMVPGPLSAIDAQLDRCLTEIDMALQNVTRSMSAKNSNAKLEYGAVLSQTHFVGVVVSLAGVLAVIASITLVARQIVGPLCEITRAAQQIKMGNYHVALKYTSSDEIGVLADAFRDMSQEVEKRTQELQVSNEQLLKETNERRQAEEEIGELNTMLEKRVMQRTEQLSKANQQYQVVLATQKQTEEELRNSHEQLRNLSQHLQAVREEERTIIAREIHDELGQSLTALKMDVSWLGNNLPAGLEPLKAKTAEMLRYIDETIRMVQRISAELRPGILDDLGCMAAIEWLAQEFQKRTGISCEISGNYDCDTLDRYRATALFRIIQEALTNISRHAEASMVWVSMDENDKTLVVSITDNGRGLSDASISDPNSLGLIGMRERARLFGGEVEVSPLAEGGTSVRMIIPLERS